MDKVDQLLQCPRGRRLCAALVEDASEAFGRAVRDVTGDFARYYGYVEPQVAVARLLKIIAEVASGQLRELSEESLLRAVVTTVDDARYWQEPDSDERVYARSDVRDALRPVAQALTTSPLPAAGATHRI